MQCDRDRKRSKNTRRLIGSLGFTVLTLSLCATVSWAGSSLKLGSLLANPESYHSKIVRITGTVSDYQLKHIKRWANGIDKCVQSFTVKDETGSMYAAYGANCSGAMDLLRNRDRVTLEARFEWQPGKPGTLNVQQILAKMAPYP